MIVTASIDIILTRIWRFHGSEWNTSQQLTLDKLGNNSVYDTEIGSTGGLIDLANRGLSDWLFGG